MIVRLIKAGKDELFKNETKEIEIISDFLPKQLNDSETKKFEDAIGSVNAKSIKEMGKVIGTLESDKADALDFSKVSTIIKEI